MFNDAFAVSPKGIAYAAEEEFVCKDGVCFKRGYEYKLIIDKNQFKEPVIHEPQKPVPLEGEEVKGEQPEEKKGLKIPLTVAVICLFLLLGLLVGGDED